METFAILSGIATFWGEVAHWKLFDLQRDPRCKGRRTSFRVMGTFAIRGRIRSNQGEVAHWKLPGVMETFAILRKSYKFT